MLNGRKWLRAATDAEAVVVADLAAIVPKPASISQTGFTCVRAHEQ